MWTFVCANVSNLDAMCLFRHIFQFLSTPSFWIPVYFRKFRDKLNILYSKFLDTKNDEICKPKFDVKEIQKYTKNKIFNVNFSCAVWYGVIMAYLNKIYENSSAQIQNIFLLRPFLSYWAIAFIVRFQHSFLCKDLLLMYHPNRKFYTVCLWLRFERLFDQYFRN